MYNINSLPVKSSQHTSSEVAVIRRCKVAGIYINPSGTAGTVRLLDGGDSGTEILKLSTPADATKSGPVPIPGYLEFGTNCYVELTNVTDVTLFYD